MDPIRRLIVPFAVVAALLAASSGAAAQSGAPSEPFLRFPAVSPDGATVAFAYQGDIFRVPVEGGLATRLTVHEAYESRPRFSPDGSRIAFQSTRWGSEDVFVMDADGGAVRRLTHHSADDRLGGWTPGGDILFATERTWVQVEWEPEIHRVAADGGTPDRLLDAVGFSPVASPDGRFVVFTFGANRRSKVGYRGPANRDLWIHDTEDGGYRPLTDFDGNDMLAAWAGERTLLFLSDRDGGGAYNLYRLELDRDGSPAGEPRALTDFPEDGVRAFGVSAEGSTVVFARRTSLWVMEEGEEDAPRRLEVRIPRDGHFVDTERETFRDRAEEYAVSPNGELVALVVRGDIYLIENESEEGRTVRLTRDVGRDRDVAWMSDTTLVFASDRDGVYDLYRLESEDPGESDLFQSLKHRTVPLTDTEVPEREPVVSPDGGRIAWVQANAPYAAAPEGALLVARLEGGELAGRRTLLDGWAVPRGVTWSPDGRWLAYARDDLDFNSEVFVLAADGSEGPVNVSQHPRTDVRPVWSADGSRLGFLSTRNNGDADVWFAWLREEDWERTAEDWDLLEEREEEQDEEAEEDGEEDADADTVRIDLDRIHERLEQVTSLPGNESDPVVAEDGETFYFVTNRDAWRESGGDQDVWKASWDGTEVERLASGGESPSSLRLGPEGEHLFLLNEEGRLGRIAVESGEEEGLSFAARTRIDHRAERAQIFDEAWRLLDRNFYDPAFHGRDWAALRERYRPRALAASTKRDFRDVFNRMLGELNASHMGLYGPDRSETEDEETGLLGVEIDPVEDGVRIERVVPESPADREASRLRAGEVITAVGGTPVAEAPNFYALLADRADRRTLLTVRGTDGEEREVVIRPTASLEDELYDEWVEERRRLTEEYSDGRLGYIHVEGMNWPSFERFERELEAAGDGRDGLLVDVRFNGGGWTTDYLLTVLTYPQHAYTVPRGAADDLDARHEEFRDHYPFGERLPQAWWTKPVAALANQNSYSNAEIFSHAFKTLDLGPLVGEPTFGAVISTGGAGLLDGSFVRLPFRGWYVKATDENMEHGPAVPDHRVPRRPDDRADGEDTQLRKAVEVLLDGMGGGAEGS